MKIVERSSLVCIKTHVSLFNSLVYVVFTEAIHSLTLARMVTMYNCGIQSGWSLEVSEGCCRRR